MNITIAIVEDNTTLRKRLQQELELFDDFEIAGAFATGEAAIKALKTWPPSRVPHVVLMDIALPGMSGVDATRQIRDAYPDTDIIMITVFEDDEWIFRSIQAGASGYLLKDDSPDSVATAIRDLRNGGAPMSRSIARKVLTSMRGSAPPAAQSTAQPGDAVLSDRELELLQGLVAGDSYTKLADKLFISPHTVRTHIKNIYKKLHVHTRATAVRAAIDRKLV